MNGIVALLLILVVGTLALSAAIEFVIKGREEAEKRRKE